jgi:hypothetical protein
MNPQPWSRAARERGYMGAYLYCKATSTVEPFARVDVGVKETRRVVKKVDKRTFFERTRPPSGGITLGIPLEKSGQPTVCHTQAMSESETLQEYDRSVSASCLQSLVQLELTEAYPRDDLAHGAIQVLQHAEVVFLTLRLLKQLLAHTWQLGVCDVGTERLRMRQYNRVNTNHEIGAIFWVRTLRSGYQSMVDLRRQRL